MYPGNIVWFLSIVNLIGLIIVTILVWKNRIFLKTLFPVGNVKRGNLKEKLEEVLVEIKGLEDFKKKSLTNIQNISLKRYNPYRDTGGNQSFSLSLLNGKGDGFIITSLHSRSGTRVFAKPVKNGKEDGFEFSEEEKEVILESIKAAN